MSVESRPVFGSVILQIIAKHLDRSGEIPASAQQQEGGVVFRHAVVPRGFQRAVDGILHLLMPPRAPVKISQLYPEARRVLAGCDRLLVLLLGAPRALFLFYARVKIFSESWIVLGNGLGLLPRLVLVPAQEAG